jgi:DNA-binding CsgD family transcriptional regulator
MMPVLSQFGPHDRSQIASFSQSNDFSARLTSAFALVTDWSAAMAGNIRFENVVTTLAHQVGAARCGVYRFSRLDGKIQPIVTVAREIPEASEKTVPDGLSVLTGSMLRFMLGFDAAQIAAGGILRLTNLREEPAFNDSEIARLWDAAPDIAQASVLIMDVTEKTIDMVEILYTAPPDYSVDLPAPILAGALAEAWALRTPGVILGLIGKYGVKKRLAPDSFESHILSPNNPFALSRSQQKVCQLLAAGQKANDIATLLGVSITTVRSHLSQIYAKTGTSGQIEILALINAGARVTAP